MKTRKLRLLSALLALAMMLALLPTAAFAENSIVDSGNCGTEGDNVTWTLDDNGTLTISGSGKMKDFIADMAPWYNVRENIQKIVIKDGVTSIGYGAFYDCKNATTVDIPNSVTSIHYGAFQYSGLTRVTIPASVETLAWSAFDGCIKLQKVEFASGIKLEKIETQTFWNCPELKEITIPNSVTTIEISAFGWCANLKKVIFEKGSKLNQISDIDWVFYQCPGDLKIICDESVKQVLVKAGMDENKIETYLPEPDPEPKTYPITIDYGTAYDADHNAITKAAAGEKVYLEADETAFDGMVFEYWKDHEGNVTLVNDHAAKTSFTMPDGEVHLEAMYKAADNDDTSWDAATVVTGVAIGTGTAILAYHIGTELYAEQVLGKGVAVPRTRADVALLAWRLAGSPAVELNGEPLSEAAQAEKWAVESGLMQLDAEGNFNGAKKMSKLKALRVLEKAQKLN